MDFSDQLPRVFQANAYRFYQRVILPTIDRLPRDASAPRGEASTLDDFLTRCAAQVDNYVANEAAKAFVLTLDGMFERQLGRWAAEHKMTQQPRTALRLACAQLCAADQAAVGIAEALEELHLVANVVRHGDGRSCSELQTAAPQLWSYSGAGYCDLAPGAVPTSEEMRIGPDELRHYVHAVVRFWGRMDPLPEAALEPPC